jgi:putative membrane protein
VAPIEKPGLQLERTHLSWERTAIGFLAIGAIVLFNSGGPLREGRTTLALLAIAPGLVTFGISRMRGRTALRTDQSGRTVISAPGVPVWLIGGATAFLAAALLIALVLNH